jgi:hypothetical protein
LNRRLRFMRPADCPFPIPRQNWCMWEDSNLRCSPLLGHSFTGCCRRRWATHAWRSATESNSHPSRGASGFGPDCLTVGGTLRFKLAVGAGLEPAHVSRREPRFRRGAIPFRSSYRYRQCGGDDPIRTDGALKGHSVLAVRCLNHSATSPCNFWWGWRDSNSHAQRPWFLRPVCLPVPPHPPYLLTPINLDTHRAIRSHAKNPSKNMVGSQGLEP